MSAVFLHDPASRPRPVLSVGTEVRVAGPNIWNETDDLGRPGRITQIDVLGDCAVEYTDDFAPRGSWFTPEHLEVLA